MDLVATTCLNKLIRKRWTAIRFFRSSGVVRYSQRRSLHRGFHESDGLTGVLSEQHKYSGGIIRHYGKGPRWSVLGWFFVFSFSRSSAKCGYHS